MYRNNLKTTTIAALLAVVMTGLSTPSFAWDGRHDHDRGEHHHDSGKFDWKAAAGVAVGLWALSRIDTNHRNDTCASPAYPSGYYAPSAPLYQATTTYVPVTSYQPVGQSYPQYQQGYAVPVTTAPPPPVAYPPPPYYAGDRPTGSNTWQITQAQPQVQQQYVAVVAQPLVPYVDHVRCFCVAEVKQHDNHDHTWSVANLWHASGGTVCFYDNKREIVPCVVCGRYTDNEGCDRLTVQAPRCIWRDGITCDGDSPVWLQ